MLHYYHHRIVRKNEEITDSLPSQSGEIHFEYSDDAALLARHRQLKKAFSTLEVHPIHNSGSTLNILIEQNWIERRHGQMSFTISDWANVEFRYDYQKQAFVVSDVKLGGI